MILYFWPFYVEYRHSFGIILFNIDDLSEKGRYSNQINQMSYWKHKYD